MKINKILKISIYTLFAIIVLVFMAASVVYYTQFTSTANMDDFQEYFVDSKVKKTWTLKVTYLGATTLIFDDGKTQVMFDAFVSRYNLYDLLYNEIKTDSVLVDSIYTKLQLDRLKAIFVSHTHCDHALDVSYFASKKNADIYGSRSMLNIGRGASISEDNLHLFKKNTSYTIGDFSVTVLPSIHSKPNEYNNDLGVEITSPLKLPTTADNFKEGGSYDFLIQHGKKRIIIRPSFNYIEHAFDTIQADVLFLGIGGLGKADSIFVNSFYYETIHKIKPGLVIPIHWDNFFAPLSSNVQAQIKCLDDVDNGIRNIIHETKELSVDLKLMNPYDSYVIY